MQETVMAIVCECKEGILRVKNLKELGNYVFKNVVWRQGRSGVPYATFKTRDKEIMYFPHGKYGAFLTEKK